VGFEPEAIYQTYKQALVSAFAIEPMLAYRQLQQMEFDPTRETIDVYASSILRCLRVLFPDSMKVNLECNGNCIDLCKDQLASKAFWAGLRNYPRLSDLMTQWMTGEKGFANAVRVVRVALSNTGDDQKMIMSYTKNQNGNQKATENNQSEHKNRYTRDKDDKYQKSYYPNKEITKLQCYHCGRRGHSKKDCYWANKSKDYDNKMVRMKPLIYRNYLVDTGATLTMITSSKTTNKFRITEPTITVPVKS
jgi:hypothetical protein